MPSRTDTQSMPAYGLHPEQRYPAKARRPPGQQRVYKRRICTDDRNYTPIQFTIPGTLSAGDFGPMWRADRDYYFARISGNVGRHDDDDHPDDGTPSGQAILVNMRRVLADLSADAAVMANDSRVNIPIDHHHDATNDDEDGELVEADFNVLKLFKGEHIYPRISQVGSGRPGTGLVVTAVLVPVP